MATAPGSKPVSAGEFAEVYEHCKNWGRWGAKDQRGALNFITPGRVAAAAALVRSGITVGCSWPLDTTAAPDNPKPVVHYAAMLADTDVGDGGDLRFTVDFVSLEVHGDAHSHVDALCHVVYRGRLYNGLPVEQAVTSAGASRQTIDVASDGLVSRGVLLDVPRLRGTGWLEPGEALMREELEAAERAQGVRMGEGDVVLLRTGHARKRLDEGPWDSANAKAGVHTSAMPLFHERRVAAIGFEGDGEAVPSNCEGVKYPVHAIGVNAMGLYFLDSLFLEDLAAACEVQGRWEFLLVIAPLRLVAGTGSPVNPIAVL